MAGHFGGALLRTAVATGVMGAFSIGVLNTGLIASARAQEGGITTLYALTDWSTTGYWPLGLAMDNSGALYGATQYGGNYQGEICGNCATVYKLNPPAAGGTAWTYQLLHTMTIDPIQGYSEDGTQPVGALTTFQNVMYGTTHGGGDTQCGCGIIYSIAPNGTYTILHAFDPISGVNGMEPEGGVLIAGNGTMYGTTSAGGTSRSGTVYTMSVNGGGFQVIHNFSGNSTAGPQGELIFGQDGYIYGTTYGGGAHGQGLIFRMSTDGSVYQDIYDFQGQGNSGQGHDGAQPTGRLAVGPDGTIYGTTHFGGTTPAGDGTIWSIKANGNSWTYTQLYIFQTGELPWSGVILASDGALYGTGVGGGAYGSGVVYRLVPTGAGQWSYQILHNFIGQDGTGNGDEPIADLLYVNGRFYGANLEGGDYNCGNANGCGTVFQFNPPVTAHDFNGDRMSDILWRDTSGDVAMWLMSGAAVAQSAGIGNASTAWSVVGQRDFHGHGKDDILWHDSSGDVAIWEMNGPSVIQSSGVGNAPTTWSVVGTGDFNGDGYADVLWHDTGGNVAIWEMNGSTVIQSCGVGNAPTTWSIAGTGDFNGDGITDILWRDGSGDVAIWFMSGCTVTQSSGVGNAPTTWAIAGTGDFNGDGKSDILWHDTSGDVAIWEMNAAHVSQSLGVGKAPTTWSIAQTGDYNGDGKSDILWRDTSGDVAVWEMNGGTVIQSAGTGNAPTTWSIQGAGAD